MWTVEYYSVKVQQAILSLPPTVLARYLQYVVTMLEEGANLGMPHTRAMGDGLFELRVKGKEGIARVFYCTQVGRRIIVLHSFVKKTQKTPIKELEIARKRMTEIRS